jgi:hypothetical protein
MEREMKVPTDLLGFRPWSPPRSLDRYGARTKATPTPAKWPFFSLARDYSTISVTVNVLDSEPADPVTVKV